MGDELRGENLVHLSVRFSTETELKQFQDVLYVISGLGVSFRTVGSDGQRSDHCNRCS